MRNPEYGDHPVYDSHNLTGRAEDRALRALNLARDAAGMPPVNRDLVTPEAARLRAWMLTLDAVAASLRTGGSPERMMVLSTQPSDYPDDYRSAMDAALDRIGEE